MKYFPQYPFENLKRRDILKLFLWFSCSTACLSLIQGCSALRYSRTRKTKLGNKEFLILGSGITGLCSGALLAKLGHKVTILERNNNLIGGHARTKTIRGVDFCVGPQYVWLFDPEKPYDIGTKVLNFLGIKNDNPFVRLSKNEFEIYQLEGNEPVSIPMGIEKLEKIFQERYPTVKPETKQLFTDINLISKCSKYLFNKGLFIENIDRIIFDIITGSYLSFKEKVRLLHLYDKSLNQLLEEYLLPDDYRMLLYSNNGIFCENIESISFPIFATAICNYHTSAFFPKFGFKKLIESLCKIIVDNDGKIYTNKFITSITTEDRFAKSVDCNDGTSYKSDIMISTISPRLTCAFLKKCNIQEFKYQPSYSLTSCFIVLKKKFTLIKLSRKNFWWNSFPEKVDYENVDMYEPPKMVYANSSTANGVVHVNNIHGYEALTLFIPGNFQQAKKTFNNSRQYQKLKEKIKINIVKWLSDIIHPNIQDYIETFTVMTPYDIFLEIGAEMGNVYGKRPNVENTLRSTKKIQNVKNLYLASSSVSYPGIATAFKTASILVESLTGIKI